MRIAVFHTQTSGGARRALHGFCRELAQQHYVGMYSLSSADRWMLQDDDVASNVVRLHYAQRAQIRFGLWLNDAIRAWDLITLDRVNARAAALIDGSRYDVVLVDACRYTYAPWILRHLRTPSVYYSHGGSWHLRAPWKTPASAYERARLWWHAPFERARVRRVQAAERTNARCATSIATNSEHSRSQIRDAYGRDAAVCPPGVELPRAVPGPRGDHVVSIGALEAHKGFDFVIEALATIPHSLRPVLHILANDGNPLVRRRLESMAHERGVSLMVRVASPREDLESELATARCFVYGAHREPLGLAPLEAMAYGVPVVAVGEGGLLETVEHGVTGFLTPRDPAAFAHRVAQLLGSPALAASFGRRGRAAVSARWTWPQRAAALETLLRATARRSHPAVAVG